MEGIVIREEAENVRFGFLSFSTVEGWIPILSCPLAVLQRGRYSALGLEKGRVASTWSTTFWCFLFISYSAEDRTATFYDGKPEESSGGCLICFLVVSRRG